MRSSAKLGWALFFFEMWFQKNLAAFTKFLLAGKRVFDSDFIILILLTFVDGIFQKKNRHLDWVLVITKKISARYNKVSLFAEGGENFGSFWPLGLPKLPEGGLWEF
jgi:hypothetical protein